MPAASSSGAALGRGTTRVSASAVPSEFSSTPGASAPRASRPQMWSCPPTPTTQSGGSPVASAASGSRVPSRVPEAASSPVSDAGRPAASSSSSDQRAAAMSSSMVREARLRSVAGTPQRRQASQPLTPSQRSAASSAAGSLARCQSSFGRVKVGSGHRPVMACRRSAPTRSTSRASSPAGRPSYQASTGAVGRPAPSSSTPASPMLATATERMRAGRSTPATAPRIAATAARHSASASCSPWPGPGRRVGVGAEPSATARPAGSNAMARMRLVPASTPRRSGSAKGLSRAGGRPRPRPWRRRG